MLRSGDVIWEPDAVRTVEKSGLDSCDHKSKKSGGSKKKRPVKDQCQSYNELGGQDLPSNGKVHQIKSSNSTNGVTLKDLNQEDKQKIAQLIKELAKVGEEKENIVHALNSERQKFLSHVRQLEEEKSTLVNKQQFLAEEVKQCQTLLQYYQNLITMQQTSILAREGSEKPTSRIEETPVKRPNYSPLQHTEPGATTSIEDLSSQSGDVRVNEVYSDNASTANSSVTEDEVLRMSDNQYNAYLRGKKEKLKREQESLRKLLSLKVQADTDLDEIEISPVRGLSDQSVSSNTTVKMRSVPVQTLSPILSKRSASYVAPSRGVSNQMQQKSLVSSQSSKTLKRSTSPEKILHILSQEVSTENVPAHETSMPYSSAHPLSGCANNLSISSSDASIATNVMNCDESQILQDVFFV